MNTFDLLSRRNTQSGVSLMELLVAMAISLVVTLAMVGLMANTMGSGTQTIQMSRLTAELRTSLQIMSRDVRRANFHGNFAKCFGNPDCRTTLDTGNDDATDYIKSITIDDSVTAGDNDCFFYWFDRDANRDVNNDDNVGAFRRIVENGVGIIQMSIDRDTEPSCTSGGYWTALTDPSFVNITQFTVLNAADADPLTMNGGSYTDLNVTTSGVDQSIDKIGITIRGQLVNNPAINKTVQDLIRIRNDIFTP